MGLESVDWYHVHSEFFKVSHMSELALEIEMLLDEEVPPKMIAVRLGVPVNFVYDVVEMIQDAQYEELDPFNTINS